MGAFSQIPWRHLRTSAITTCNSSSNIAVHTAPSLAPQFRYCGNEKVDKSMDINNTKIKFYSGRYLF